MLTFKCPSSKYCLFHGSWLFQNAINEKREKGKIVISTVTFLHPVSIIGTTTCKGFWLTNFLFFSSAPSVLTLTAVKHLLSGVIKTLTETNDITVNIRSDLNLHIFGQLSPCDFSWMFRTPQ